MRSLRALLLLAVILLGMVSCARDLHMPRAAYGTMTLTVDGSSRVYCEGGLHPQMDISTRIYDRYLTSPQTDFKTTLFANVITEADAREIFKAALDTLQQFRFDRPKDPGIMDGDSVVLAVQNSE